MPLHLGCIEMKGHRLRIHPGVKTVPYFIA